MTDCLDHGLPPSAPRRDAAGIRRGQPNGTAICDGSAGPGFLSKANSCGGKPKKCAHRRLRC